MGEFLVIHAKRMNSNNENKRKKRVKIKTKAIAGMIKTNHNHPN